jgi:hypothetical protein
LISLMFKETVTHCHVIVVGMRPWISRLGLS